MSMYISTCTFLLTRITLGAYWDGCSIGGCTIGGCTIDGVCCLRVKCNSSLRLNCVWLTWFNINGLNIWFDVGYQLTWANRLSWVKCNPAPDLGITEDLGRKGCPGRDYSSRGSVRMGSWDRDQGLWLGCAFAWSSIGPRLGSGLRLGLGLG